MTPDDKADRAPLGAQEPSLVEMVRLLAGNARLLAEAEVELRKAQAAFIARHAKRIALLVVFGLFFAFFALMALVVGLLLALTPLVGGWGAMAIVVVALALLTGLCALGAVSGAKAIARGLKGPQ
ncbi:phage holin family protein [Novosphingobium sp. FKTRR1]|uniref:phage holin family protein n=1 Tax=Novosphingobium sp. FKTRR1 TaxID=2879118 RepID=UPI001CF02ACB|nr:phage holin family protein [Novosphingobium sp. FKTRR1]